MNTISSRLMTVDPDNPDSLAIADAAALLLAGQLVVAPTETRYGLLADAASPAALERLVGAKGRPANAPTAVFLPSWSTVNRIAQPTQEATALAEAFLPGPLTVIVTARQPEAWDQSIVRNGKIGVRISPAPVIRDILARVDRPLTATSANTSGAGEHDTIHQVQADLGETVALYLDSGVRRGVVSTVVDATQSPVRILREGALSAAEIGRVVSWQQDD